MISGCADFKAEAADFLSPDVIASSTFFKKVRIRDLRALFTSSFRSFCLALFLTEAYLPFTDPYIHKFRCSLCVSLIRVNTSGNKLLDFCYLSRN